MIEYTPEPAPTETWACIGPQLAELVSEMMRALDNESDVDDGPDGQPVANDAMRFQMTGACGPEDGWHERASRILKSVGIDWKMQRRRRTS